MDFDLALFRRLAFGKQAEPDHPISDEQEARKLVEALLQDAPAKALAELTHWVVSLNENDSFTPGRRARVLTEMNAAAYALWRLLGADFLAPAGVPSEGRDGDHSILQALHESALEFARGFDLCLAPAAVDSRWIKDNLAAVVLRRARWLTRKMILSRMLHLPGADERWAELHQFYHFAVGKQVFRNVMQVFPDHPMTSSAKQEYVRMLLVDIARPDRMPGRDMELAFRIIGRVAASVQLEREPTPGALHVVVPEGSQRPVALAQLAGKPPESALYLDASNALPRLRAMLERDMDTDASEPDPMFGQMFTIRERRAVVNLLLDQWGSGAPQRRARRIELSTPVIVYHGFDGVVKAVTSLDQGGWNITADAGADPGMRIQLDEAERKPDAPRKIVRATKGQLYDLSTTGVGVTLARREAGWATLGTLLAVFIEPGPEWIVGVLRRMNSEGEHLRMGISVLSRRPRLAWFHVESTGYASVWEEEKRYERNFLEHFQPGVLLEAGSLPLDAGEMVLAQGEAERGTRFDLPLGQGVQRLVVTALREQTQDFKRIAFEPHGITPYASKPNSRRS